VTDPAPRDRASASKEPIATPLPRGRHNLSREQVRAIQRNRIFAALVTSVGEQGYTATSVADILRIAGVSRESFYAQFANKQDCFLAAYAEASAQTTTALRAAVAASGDQNPVSALKTIVGAYLHGLQARPDAARTFLIEVYAAGPDALQRRTELLATFGELINELLEPDPRFRSYSDPEFFAHAFAGTVSALVGIALARGDDVISLQAPLVALVDDLLAARRAGRR
jgi:AcrR family transcriptional regulator